MKILVTGAGGFLGRHIVERLLVHGQTDIRCLIRDPCKRSRLNFLKERYPTANLDIALGNLRYARDIASAVDGVGLVIHAAAAMKGSAAEIFLDSVVASRNLLDAIVGRRPMRVVLISSFGALGVADLGRDALIDEQAPLEPHPERRDVYSYAKLSQESLFWQYREKYGLDLTVLRPGVIYGPGSNSVSSRVGFPAFGTFFHLGGKNLLPLTHVENCSEAVALVALREGSDGEVYHIVDDEVITSRQYLRLYRDYVLSLRTVSVPYPVLMLLSHVFQWYSNYSKGQLPAVFTPYKTKTTWGGNRFSNAKLHSIGWKQIVPAGEGLRRSFEAFGESSKSQMFT
jgi:nucleoside-diphosphate-sugar epimerase